jgi:hypothetical protein
MNILIGGDLVPTASNMELFNKALVKDLLGGDLCRVWMEADARIFNLEAPLTDRQMPISKYGPNMSAPVSSFNGVQVLAPSVVSLANNHILDQGLEGLESTRELFRTAEIPTVGAGENLSEARKPYIFNEGGKRVGIYSCAEHEFSIATPATAGANPFDPLESLDHIVELKQVCDFVIVLYHGGKEFYPYPSPYLQKATRKMAEKGADLVICQHSHCIGCCETYGKSTIVYGQGNFIFDASEEAPWQSSLLIQAEVDDELRVGYIPIRKQKNTIRLAEGKEAEEILEAFWQRSGDIQFEGFIEGNYQQFAEQHLYRYLRAFSGSGKWVSRVDRKLFHGAYLKNRFTSSKKRIIQNYVECEAHRELLLVGLKAEEK